MLSLNPSLFFIVYRYYYSEAAHQDGKATIRFVYLYSLIPHNTASEEIEDLSSVTEAFPCFPIYHSEVVHLPEKRKACMVELVFPVLTSISYLTEPSMTSMTTSMLCSGHELDECLRLS